MFLSACLCTQNRSCRPKPDLTVPALVKNLQNLAAMLKRKDCEDSAESILSVGPGSCDLRMSICDARARQGRVCVVCKSWEDGTVEGHQAKQGHVCVVCKSWEDGTVEGHQAKQAIVQSLGGPTD
eukprot:1161184-Pelagomonas_calceolata.AAC.6